ncbi:MAG TPA: methionine aminotransferase [Robiginitalea sp.]|nr:methionine aminotransferase [Robiginitalea sp.]
MTPSLHSKLPGLKPSIFSEMNRIALEAGALNLAQGFPDFGVDPELLTLHREAMEAGHNQYAPMPGVLSLREAIAAKTESMYGAAYDPESEITVTAGATQAIYSAIAAVVNPGDEVIIFKPAYDSYEPNVMIHGGVPVLLPLQGPGFRIDWEAFDRALGPKTRMVILNTPHNPSGTVLEADDLRKLEQRLSPTNTLVLSDEVYEHLIFDGRDHQSVCRFPGLRERAFVCASFGKTFHVTGWKMGYCLAPQPLMREFRKMHEFVVFSVSHATQKALVRYLKNPAHYLNLPGFFQRKRDLFLSGLAGSRFSFTPAAGTYFQVVDYAALSEEADVAFAERLAREHGVAGIPISVFNLGGADHRQLRFCFAKKDETIARAAEILGAL